MEDTDTDGKTFHWVFSQIKPISTTSRLKDRSAEARRCLPVEDVIVMASLETLLYGRFQSMILPPLTSSAWPVIQDDASEARNRAAWATSSGVPRRRRGKLSATLACISAGMNFSSFSLRTTEGAIAFTRIPKGPSSCAKWRINMSVAACAAPYAAEA